MQQRHHGFGKIFTALVLVAVAVSTVGPVAAPARGGPAASAPKKDSARRQAAAATLLAYGTDERQNVRLFAPPAGGAALRGPIILFIHGGGWSFGRNNFVDAKPEWAARHGLWFGSVGYRLLPDAPVEDQARDVGAAIRAVRAAPAKHGYDPDRIILMGHSAGAHLAALVATDPGYAGGGFNAIRAVIPIDGAGFDVMVQMRDGRGPLMRFYTNAFGNDKQRQRALSPVTHAGRGDTSQWLIIHVANRAASAKQASLLAAPLQSGGIHVTIKPISGTHMTANRDFGKTDYPAQPEVDALVRQVIAAR